MLCRKFEGLRLEPYLCGSSIATIGYGTTFYENGVPVTMSDPPITEKKADEIFRFVIFQRFWKPMLENMPELKRLNAFQLGALLSFSYNSGWTKYDIGRFDTLDRAVRENASEIPSALKLYNKKAGGIVSEGLVVRRQAEILLYNGATAEEAYRRAYGTS